MDCSDTEKDSSDTETAIVPGEYSEKKFETATPKSKRRPSGQGRINELDSITRLDTWPDFFVPTTR